MMQKLILAAVAAALLAGTEHAADIRIGLVPKALGNGFFDAANNAANNGANEAAKEIGGVNIIYTGSLPRLLTITFTIADFVRSSLWQFEAFPYRTAPKGLPSSLVQHDALASS
jgi:hypothetical protein